MPTASSGFQPLSLPTMAATAWLEINIAAASVAAPSLTLDAYGQSHPLDGAALTTPSLLVVGYSGATLKASVNCPAVTISGEVVSVGHATLTIPAVSLSTALSTGAVASVSVALPHHCTLGAFSGGYCNTAIRASFTLAAEATQGSVAQAYLSVPGVTLEAHATAEGYAAADLVAPRFHLLSGILDANFFNMRLGTTSLSMPVQVNEAVVMNTLNHALTQYQNMPFNNIVRVGGAIYGVSSNALYLLESDTDDGVAISASFETQPITFNDTMLKNVPYVYLAARSGSVFTVGSAADEVYRAGGAVTAHGHTGVYNYRAQLGRGVRSVSWGFTVANIGGSDFQIQELHAMPLTMSRRI